MFLGEYTWNSGDFLMLMEIDTSFMPRSLLPKLVVDTLDIVVEVQR